MDPLVGDDESGSAVVVLLLLLSLQLLRVVGRWMCEGGGVALGCVFSSGRRAMVASRPVRVPAARRRPLGPPSCANEPAGRLVMDLAYTYSMTKKKHMKIMEDNSS